MIPAAALSPEALAGVIDEFIHREGTDYGHREYTLEEKRSALRRSLESGEAVITFDPGTGTTTIIPAAEYSYN
jgi:uncharacterized protein YheU (UPF0270 family)